MCRTEPETHGLQWRKSRSSVGDGECVQVASADGHVVVRDSKKPGGSWLYYSALSWCEFITRAKGNMISDRL